MSKEIIVDPDLEDREKEGYYYVRFYCGNCHNSTGLGFDGPDVMVPKGRPVEGIKITCPNCGCPGDL